MIALKVLSVVTGWFAVFTIGLTVDSTSCGTSFFGLVLFVAASTSTNVGILAVLASLLSDALPSKSIRRGMAIYLMLLAGTLSIFPDTIAEQYAKIAGLLSLVCVVVGYKPEVFDTFLDRIVAAVIGENKVL